MIPTNWSEESGQLHSLPLCLRAVFADSSKAPSYDELLAALGLGSLAVAPKSGDDFDALYAQETYLSATAALFGIRLRELHPRRTARGLDHSAEFPQHFIDSYIPLIARAHDVGQPTLVCRGWPPPRQHEWGLITSVSGESLAGMTIGHIGEPVPLIGPPLFAYVIEVVDETGAAKLSAIDQLARAAWIAVEQYKQLESSDAEFYSGPRAWLAWREFCRRQSGVDSAQSRSFVRMVSRWLSARAAQARWLEIQQPQIANPAREVVTNWREACLGIHAEISQFLARPVSSADRWLQLDAALGRAFTIEERLVEQLSTIAKPLFVRPAYEAAPLCI